MSNISGMGGGVGRERRMDRLSNVASSDACSGEWDDGGHTPKPWVARESWRGMTLRTPSLEYEVGQSSSRKLWIRIKELTTWSITRLMSWGSLCHMSNIYGSYLMSLTCSSHTPVGVNIWQIWSSNSV